jgi:DeoR/GlpR family transcriptional regulator of sugar metabolism
VLSSPRRESILELLDAQAAVSVTDLVRRFGVSDMTVRRDLSVLEGFGLLRRVHGGAVALGGRSFEPPFSVRNRHRQSVKSRIGKAAAELVSDGDSVALDVGTTTLEVARHLTGRRHITVVTPSFRAATVLADRPAIRLIVTGGLLRDGELSLVGRLAEQTFEAFFIDKLFLGVAGLSVEHGLTEFHPDDASVKKAMLRAAQERIVVADSSKLERIAFAAIAPVTAIHKLVTDSGADTATVRRLEEEGVEVLVV